MAAAVAVDGRVEVVLKVRQPGTQRTSGNAELAAGCGKRRGEEAKGTTNVRRDDSLTAVVEETQACVQVGKGPDSRIFTPSASQSLNHKQHPFVCGCEIFVF